MSDKKDSLDFVNKWVDKFKMLSSAHPLLRKITILAFSTYPDKVYIYAAYDPKLFIYFITHFDFYYLDYSDTISFYLIPGNSIAEMQLLMTKRRT
jgi:hypothetical protein